MSRSAGEYDRRVTLERATFVTSDYNESVPTWLTVKAIWAKRSDASANESYRASAVGAEISTRWVVRYGATTSTITPKDRLVYRRRIYEITGIREVEGQRNRELEIDSVARSDVEDSQ